VIALTARRKEFVAGADLTDFFDRFLHGTEELPLSKYLEAFGLAIEPQSADVPYFGARLSEDDNSRAIVRFVEVGSPAQRAGIAPDDEILAIDGYRVTTKAFNSRLQDYASGETIAIACFHDDELIEVSITLEDPQPQSYRIVPVDSPSDSQARHFQAWLRTAIADA